tara:strand:+ start:3012 stop:3332 length:321 start_codon:yes stop_codon:yes gene_type:complete
MLRTLLLTFALLLPSCALAKNKKMPPFSGLLETKAVCLDYEYIAATLKMNKEQLRLSLLKSDKEMIEIWAGETVQSWTIVLRSLNQKTGCIMGTGIGLFLFKPTSI